MDEGAVEYPPWWCVLSCVRASEGVWEFRGERCESYTLVHFALVRRAAWLRDNDRLSSRVNKVGARDTGVNGKEISEFGACLRPQLCRSCFDSLATVRS